MANGQWELTMTAANGGSHTSSRCWTAEEANASNGDSKAVRESIEKSLKGGQCAIKSFEIAGDKVSYALACGSYEIANTTTYHGDSFEGLYATTTGGKSEIAQIKARRVGACP